MKKRLSLLLAILFLPVLVFAQNTISGVVTEAGSNEPIIGANVFLLESSQGAATLLDGSFEIKNVENGTYTIRVSSVGFTTITQEVRVNGDIEMDFELSLTS